MAKSYGMTTLQAKKRINAWLELCQQTPISPKLLHVDFANELNTLVYPPHARQHFERKHPAGSFIRAFAHALAPALGIERPRPRKTKKRPKPTPPKQDQDPCPRELSEFFHILQRSLARIHPNQLHAKDRLYPTYAWPARRFPLGSSQMEPPRKLHRLSSFGSGFLLASSCPPLRQPLRLFLKKPSPVEIEPEFWPMQVTPAWFDWGNLEPFPHATMHNHMILMSLIPRLSLQKSLARVFINFVGHHEPPLLSHLFLREFELAPRKPGLSYRPALGIPLVSWQLLTLIQEAESRVSRSLLCVLNQDRLSGRSFSPPYTVDKWWLHSVATTLWITQPHRLANTRRIRECYAYSTTQREYKTVNTDCEVGQWIDEVGGQSMVAYKLSQIVQKPVYPSMVRGWKLKNEIPANWKVIIRQNFGLNTIPQCLQLSIE